MRILQLNIKACQKIHMFCYSLRSKTVTYKKASFFRFTNENVVVTAPSKVKAGSDLQLPSMAALVSKTSSQAFFLRILKVIVQIREAVRLANTKKTGIIYL